MKEVLLTWETRGFERGKLLVEGGKKDRRRLLRISSNILDSVEEEV